MDALKILERMSNVFLKDFTHPILNSLRSKLAFDYVHALRGQLFWTDFQEMSEQNAFHELLNLNALRAELLLNFIVWEKYNKPHISLCGTNHGG